MIETLNTDYIQLARAKGLTMRQVTNRHAYRNSMIPVLTLVGPMATNILTGSALIEQNLLNPWYWSTVRNFYPNQRLSCHHGDNNRLCDDVDGGDFDYRYYYQYCRPAC